jgi:hypothetical protein
MPIQRFFLAYALVVLLPVQALSADLTKIIRTIGKQPAYRARPKYCLLVFGPEAKTRVWLVQDGDALYVDRNGNGDLTEPSKKVVAEKREGAVDETYDFRVGDIRDGSLIHKALTVSVFKLSQTGWADADSRVQALLAKNRDASGYGVSIGVEMPGWKGDGIGGRVQQHPGVVDTAGVFQFADEPEQAPILHFNGPRQITLFGEHHLTIGRESDIVLGVGTPGLGPGSTIYMDYEGVIPATAYPTVEIDYPNHRAGEPPIHERYVLKKRC